MGKPYIIDTNAIIDYIGNKLPDEAALRMDSFIDEAFSTSIIVKIEVLGFNGDAEDMLKLKDFFDLAFLYYVDDTIAAKTIALRKKYKKLKLGDAIIAATALVHGQTIITRNMKDFEPIEGLVCINPYEI